MPLTSAAYISNLDFAYCRTYSLRQADACEGDDYNQRIIDATGHMNAAAVLVRELEHTDPHCTILIASLQTEIEEEVLFLCAPVYRDAILFFTPQQHLIGGINICFSCDRIESINGDHIKTDFKTFKYLKQLLLSIGHPIEDPDHFTADEVLRLQQKHRKD